MSDVDTAPAPALLPAVDVWHERWRYSGQPAHFPTHRVVIAVDDPEGNGREYFPLPGTPCQECGLPVQRATECAASGLCLTCLYGPIATLQ